MHTTANRSTTNPPEASAVLPLLMDQDELAAYLGKSTAWCERERWKGTGPKFIKLGRHVRYRVSDVLEWLDGCPSSTKEGKADA